MIHGRRVFGVAALSALVLLAACGQSGHDGDVASLVSPLETPAVNSSDSAPLDGVTPLPVASEVALEAAGLDSPDGQPGAVFPVVYEQMLAGLGSYQLEVSVRFEGRDSADLPVRFLWRSFSVYAEEVRGYMLELSAMGNEEPGSIQSMTLVRAGEQSYLQLPGIGCVSGSSDDFEDEMGLPLNPADLLNGLSAVEFVAEGEVVNGQVISEFRFDEDALAWPAVGPWSIDGRAYVAGDTGLLTRTEMTIMGQGDLMAEGRDLSGIYEVRIDIQDLEENFTIDAPEECQQASRYPAPEDAFNLSVIEDLLAFKSLMQLDDVVDFYLSEMPASGWQLVAEPDVIEDMAFLTFQKDSGQVTISIEYDAASNGVSVLISP